MVYLLGGIALVSIGASIFLAVWIGNLKDEIIKLHADKASLGGRLSRAKLAARQCRTEKMTLALQLAKLRKRYEALARMLDRGLSGDAVVDELRRMFEDD